jgi:DNA-binding transcriptional regulator YhcF (GntR family)
VVIEFHLDARSGVAPYRQLIHQVRHALRLGLLRQGDQLPKVKDVVAGLANNPNTVLKAYRELEYEGLVGGPAGDRHVHHRDAGRRLAGCARAAAPRAAAVAGQGAARRAGRRVDRGPVRQHLPVRE